VVKVSFGTDILVHATDPRSDDKRPRALDLMQRAMFAGSGILLLQTLVELCERAHRELIPVDAVQPLIEGWRVVLPVQAPDEEDFVAALETWTDHQSFSEAVLWASAKRAGVTHILTEDASDGLDIHGVVSVDPFAGENDHLVDRILPNP
jgi:predicted nucleic acid-binding protein